MLDNYFDKIFYINLKKDVVRDSKMLQEFHKYNINNFERIDGVMHNSIPDRNLWRNFNKSDEKYVIGSLGCRDSHLKAVSIAKERKYKRILILEDDIIFVVNPNKLPFPNTEWDMLYLGGMIESHFRNQIVCPCLWFV
jgi:GR25 family glycosyltransferase involved in LPS biosynthesis